MNDAAYLARLTSRLAEKTRVGPACWEWLGSKDKDGYALIYSRETKNNVRVSHLVWTVAYGCRPELWVLHRCDNPACVRVDHLFLGTHTDNMRDKSQKGRWRGNPMARMDFVCRNCNGCFEVHRCRASTAKFLLKAMPVNVSTSKPPHLKGCYPCNS